MMVVCRCIQRNFFIFTPMSLKCFFKSLFRGDARQFFYKSNNLWRVQFSLTNLQGYGFILIQKYVLEDWGQIYQFSLTDKTTEGSSVAIGFLWQINYISFCYLFMYRFMKISQICGGEYVSMLFLALHEGDLSLLSSFN